MSDFKQYRRKQIAELRPYVVGESLFHVSIAHVDRQAGSPKAGDMIARNPKNHEDQWLVAKQYFEDNFEPMEPERMETPEEAEHRESLQKIHDEFDQRNKPTEA